MDASRFDAFTRILGAPGTRRRVLNTLLGSVCGLLAITPVADEAVAKKHKQRKRRKERRKKVRAEGPCGNGSAKANRCKRDRQCCTNYCKKKRCRCRKPGQSCTEDRNCCPEQTGRVCVDGICQGSGCADQCATGCCAGETCQPGTSSQACGTGGAPCQVCAGGQVCQQGLCQTPCGDVCAAGCPYPTIQAAIDDPNGPATIQLCADVYVGIIRITRTLTLRGAGQAADGTVLYGHGRGPVVTVDPDLAGVTLGNLRITNGNADRGGGILNAAGSDLTLNDCTIADNTASGSGGGIDNFGTLILNDARVADNQVRGSNPAGGGISNHGDVTLNGSSSVVLNHVLGIGVFGGGIYNEDGSVTLNDDSRVVLNRAIGDVAATGGGIASFNGTVTLNGQSRVEDNLPENCGGVPAPVC